MLEPISKSTYQSLFEALKLSLRNFKLLTYYDMKRKAANFDDLPQIVVLKSLPCLLELYY